MTTDENRGRGRFGVYMATVHDNRDPEKAGRLRVVVPDVMGTDPLAIWATMLGQHAGTVRRRPGLGPRPRGRGSFHVPEVGSQVAVMFLSGNVEAPVWIAGPWPRGVVPAAAQTGSYPERSVLLRGEKVDVIEDRDGNLSVSTELDGMHVAVDTRGGDLELRTDGAGGGAIKLQRGGEGQNAARITDPVACGTLTGVFSPATGALTGLVYTPPGGGPSVTLSAVLPTITLAGQITGGASLVLIGD